MNDLNIIRPMRAEDIPQCLACISDSWGRSDAAHALGELKGSFAIPSSHTFYVAQSEDGGINGMAGYAASAIDSGTFTLCWVCVRKDKRNQRLGRLLVDRCLRDLYFVAQSIVLHTQHASEFYSHNWGFKVIDRIPDGAVFMSLHF